MKKLFQDSEKQLIEGAVRAAEASTSGQIVPVVAEASADYSFVGHRVGLAGAILASGVVYFLPHFENLFWEFAYLFGAQGAGWVLGWAMGQLPAVERLVAGSRRMQEEVHESALAAFLQQGLHRTKGRNGVLVYLSWLEHRVEIVADEGVHAKVGEAYWRAEAEKVAVGFRNGSGAAALAEVVREIGAVLAQHFPAELGQANEISDDLRLK